MWKIVFLALGVSGTLSLIGLRGSPFVYSDQAFQLVCVQDWERGQSSFPNWLITADPRDLSQSRASWEIFHPPGFPILVAGCALLGCPLGGAVHGLAIICFVAGCVGWSLWALHFVLPRWIHLLLPVLIPGIRYGNDNLVHFHAEAFLFGATPWLLLATLRLARGTSSGSTRNEPALLRQIALGAGLGALYWLKYSGLLVAVGICAMLISAEKAAGRRGRWGALAIAAALPIALLSALNRFQGGTENIVTASLHFHFPLESFLFLAGTIPLTLADAGQMAETAFLNPSYGIFRDDWVVPCLGLPGFAFLAACFLRKKTWRGPERLALIFALTQAGMMLLVWMVSDRIGFDRRYLAPASLTLSPLALSVALAQYREGEFWGRVAAVAFVSFYLLLPIAYGYGSFGAKAVSSAEFHGDTSGIWDLILTRRDGREADAFLDARMSRPLQDVWYLPEPLPALDLRGRKILGYPTWDAVHSEEMIYRSSRALRVLALVPNAISDEASAAYLRHIFPQSSGWTKEVIPQANYVLWTGLLSP